MQVSDILTDELMLSWGLRGGLGGYQARAIQALSRTRRGVLVSPAGSGKTVMAARALECVLRGASRHPITVLWLANTIDQLEQAEKAFNLIEEPIRDRARVQFLCPAGVPECMLEGVDMLIVDECHHSAAPSWARVIQACRTAKVIWGLTATPHREDDQWQKVEDLIGPIIHTVSIREIEETGHRVPARVIMHRVAEKDEHTEAVHEAAFGGDSPSLFDRLWSKMKWQIHRGADAGKLRKDAESRATQIAVARICIAEFERRNSFVAELCQDHVSGGDAVLCLVATVEQGRWIAERVRDSALVFSRMTVKRDGRREDIIERFRRGWLRCLIATSLADEGLDVPAANVLVLAAGGRGTSKALGSDGLRRHTSRIEQRTGRVLRSHDGKSEGLIHDFIDEQHPFSRAQSWTRKKGYDALGYDVEVRRQIETAGVTA